MPFLRLRYVVLGFVCLMLCLPSSAKNERKGARGSHSKKVVLLSPPEPDLPLPQPEAHRNLAEQTEAPDPCAVYFRHREGIDVSHYQHEIDWKSVSEEGEVGYVYIKATEGGGLVDEMYDYNIREARKAGLKVGSYHFFRTNVSVDEQVANVTSVVKGDMQDLMLLVDVEHANRASVDRLQRMLHDFLRKLTAHYGRKPMLYTFVNFYNRYLLGGGFDDYPLMIALYREDPPQLRDGRPYVIWQYAADGSMPGIDGNVDRSVLMEGFSYNDIRW